RTPRGAAGGGTGPGRSRRRRWARLAGPVAVAVVSLAAFGLGVNQWGTSAGSQDGAATSAGDRPAPEAAGPMVGPMSTAPFLLVAEPGRNSGTDHTRQGLADRGVGPAGVADSGLSATDQREPTVPDELARLGGRPALEACLAAIVTEHAFAPVTVERLDYAAFEGRPALIVEFVDATGERWAWVSGPGCGLTGSGTDTRYRTRVG
ncbi:hypothetical protein ABT336_23875, partial [Micromonospora sp. NPDC000207]